MKCVCPLLLTLLAACGPPGELEIGIRNNAGEFEPLSSGESVAVILGANGLNMITPSLRATGIDPSKPDPSVKVSIGDSVMATILKGEPVDMTPVGDAHVLWDLRVPFLAELCCYNCASGLVTAELKDASGKRFVGEVSVQFSRDACPAPDVCCATVSACPKPEMTQVCQ